jgi:hypothetical protein
MLTCKLREVMQGPAIGTADSLKQAQELVSLCKSLGMKPTVLHAGACLHV